MEIYWLLLEISSGVSVNSKCILHYNYSSLSQIGIEIVGLCPHCYSFSFSREALFLRFEEIAVETIWEVKVSRVNSEFISQMINLKGRSNQYTILCVLVCVFIIRVVKEEGSIQRIAS